MFGWFGRKAQKTYPVLESSMLTPVDAPITSTEAKKIFKDWMLKIGYLDKQEVGEHAGYLADEIREHEELLRDEVRDAKEALSSETKEAKEVLKALKKELAGSKDEARKADLADEIADAEADLQLQTEDAENALAEAQEALTAFKADKRAFLIEYINRQVHA